MPKNTIAGFIAAIIGATIIHVTIVGTIGAILTTTIAAITIGTITRTTEKSLNRPAGFFTVFPQKSAVKRVLSTPLDSTLSQIHLSRPPGKLPIQH